MKTTMENNWAWPPGADDDTEFNVFDCPRLWFKIEDLEYHRGGPCQYCAGPVHIHYDGTRVVVTDHIGHHGVWTLIGEYDVERDAVLGVWKD